ncbi:MAG: hypothetical protein II822_00355 [Prevotella sp.]|nr:hypothetical protein [Prevotella sp.]
MENPSDEKNESALPNRPARLIVGVLTDMVACMKELIKSKTSTTDNDNGNDNGGSGGSGSGDGDDGYGI